MEPAVRKQKILAAIVESYIDTGEPVGSKSLIGESGLNVSSATVRNDMAELTSLGYIVQPHTSAGRIPTASGYRYYIDNVMRVTPVSAQGKQYISESLQKNGDSPESILQEAANLLSKLTGQTALFTTPSGENSRIRRISFVQTGARSAMAILIASNGTIKTKLFRCEYLVTPELLEVFDKALNEVFGGVKLSSVNRPFIQTAAVRFGELSLLMPSALMAIQDAAEQANTVSVCQSGRGKLAFAPDVNFHSTRSVIEFLNNEHDLALTLEKAPQHTAVLVGRENSRVELASNSVITTRYKIDGNPSGVAAMITPLRTDYAKNIAVLECVAECAGEIIEELIDTKQEQ